MKRKGIKLSVCKRIHIVWVNLYKILKLQIKKGDQCLPMPGEEERIDCKQAEGEFLE